MAQNSISYTDVCFTKQALPEKGTSETQFANCTFANCDFADADLRNCVFVDCQFVSCNFTMFNFALVGLNQVVFKACKLLGADFSKARDFLFGADFDACVMDYVVFGRKKNRKHLFLNCSLKHADFTDVDFAGCKFDNCDLQNATFVEANLQRADFSTAYNFAIDPEQNYLANAKFGSNNVAGLLLKYKLHIV